MWFILIQLFFNPDIHALEARWLGVAGVFITDGTTSLIIDPVATKPSIWNWIFNTTFKPDAEKIAEMLQASEIKKLEGVFVSHTHFDHAVDAPTIAEQFHAPIFGGPSLQTLAAAHVPHPKFVPLMVGRPVHIGKFKITGILRQHAPIFNLFAFLDGPVATDFAFRFYQYSVGETWNYFIEHTDGNILFDQGGRFHDPNIKYKGKVSTYFAGVANRLSVEDWVDRSILSILPKKVIPIHFDAFFLQNDWLEKQRLPKIGLEKLEASLKEKAPQIQWITPVRHQKIQL